jgi:exodeoxyribonuclease III
MRLYSWNVNGIRSAARQGLLTWLAHERPDVLCLQETRAWSTMLSEELLHPDGYHSYWANAERMGYSGVATFSREQPRRWQTGLGLPRFDCEGRVLVTAIAGVEIHNVYFPNGRASGERLAHKLAFYEAFLEHIDQRAASGQSVIFCGDVNTAHRPIDLARPKANETASGFLPVEREYLDRWREHGWLDTFRLLHPEERGAYSWWSMRAGARQRNIGWRLDYFFVHASLAGRVKGAGIAADVTGADHCPVWLELS